MIPQPTRPDPGGPDGRAATTAVASTARTAVILWFALTLSIVFYAVLPYLLRWPGEPDPSTGSIFLSIGLVLAAIALLYRRSALSDETLQRQARRASPGRTGSIGAGTDADLALLRVGLRNHVVAWALGESIALVGFVYTVVSREPASGLPFAAAALVLSFLTFPRLAELVERGRRGTSWAAE